MACCCSSLTSIAHVFTAADFWTTKCTRCPAALDKLQLLSVQYPQITFMSICCDSLDGARELLEQDEDLKWQGIRHYYMATEYKEHAKKLFGFKTVPFYVFVNAHGDITQSGGPVKIDFAFLPGTDEIDKENNAYNVNIQKPVLEPALLRQKQVDVFPVVVSVQTNEQSFVIDDLDF